MIGFGNGEPRGRSAPNSHPGPTEVSTNLSVLSPDGHPRHIPHGADPPPSACSVTVQGELRRPLLKALGCESQKVDTMQRHRSAGAPNTGPLSLVLPNCRSLKLAMNRGRSWAEELAYQPRRRCHESSRACKTHLVAWWQAVKLRRQKGCSTTLCASVQAWTGCILDAQGS